MNTLHSMKLLSENKDNTKKKNISPIQTTDTQVIPGVWNYEIYGQPT